MSLPRLLLLLALLAAPALLTACAEVPTDPAARAEFNAVDDPLEPLNRATFNVNDFLDRNFIKPVAKAYRYVVPEYARDRLANLLSNMGEPVILVNNVLEGQFTRAGTTTGRFLTNTVIGGAGLWDVATGWGLPKQPGDFGMTLYTWGVAHGGPYLVLPFFGPSDFRDAIGFGVDSAISPWYYLAGIGPHGMPTQTRFDIAYLGADGIVKREQNLDSLDALRAGSLDFYAQLRSVYRQYRDNQLGIKSPSAEPKFEDYN